MPAIGITGGISSGKSTFCDCLDQLVGGKFFNADRVARELVDLDSQVREELFREFGPKIYGDDGSLNREKLRAIVFENAAKKRALEQILHPRIRRQWSAEAEAHRNSPQFFFADIPLLYETQGEKLCDRVVVVACSPGIQLERLLQRGAVDKAAAEQIIQSQMPLNEKVERADHVVWNNGGRDVLEGQARTLVELWQQTQWTKM